MYYMNINDQTFLHSNRLSQKMNFYLNFACHVDMLRKLQLVAQIFLKQTKFPICYIYAKIYVYKKNIICLK